MINLAKTKVEYSKSARETNSVRLATLVIYCTGNYYMNVEVVLTRDLFSSGLTIHSPCSLLTSTLSLSLLLKSSFSLSTKYRSMVIQAGEKDVMEWLNALDPLLVGTLR